MKKEYLDKAAEAVTKTATEIKRIENERDNKATHQADKSGVFKSAASHK
jgi:hypothetical protein